MPRAGCSQTALVYPTSSANVVGQLFVPVIGHGEVHCVLPTILVYTTRGAEINCPVSDLVVNRTYVVINKTNLRSGYFVERNKTFRKYYWLKQPRIRCWKTS